MANVILSPVVADILKRSVVTETSIALPNGHLDRPIYDAVNKALVAAGGKWNKRAQAHIFPHDPRPRLGLMLDTGVAIDERKAYQSFFTPADLAARLAAMASVRGKTVLEPSAGEGAIADACTAAGSSGVDCFEIRQEFAQTLEAKGYSVGCVDFLSVSPSVNFDYDRVVMNPPFRGNQDIKHVAHAIRFSRSGGVIVAVMSAGAVEKPAFQGIAMALNRIEITPLPQEAFKESGANFSTVIVKGTVK